MNLAERMKETYELPWEARLPWRLPVLVRLDGRSFHTWTKGLVKPFDISMFAGMANVALTVASEMMGCRFAYSQSDEISFLLNNFERIESQPWFGNSIQKIVSVAAGLASATLSRTFLERPIAVFDARVFVLPEAEVANYFLWRQQDAERNSLAGLCQAHYRHQELIGKDRTQQHELLHRKGINWNEYPVIQKRGFGVHQNDEGEWVVDSDMPIVSAHREYIERHLRPKPASPAPEANA